MIFQESIGENVQCSTKQNRPAERVHGFTRTCGAICTEKLCYLASRVVCRTCAQLIKALGGCSRFLYNPWHLITALRELATCATCPRFFSLQYSVQIYLFRKVKVAKKWQPLAVSSHFIIPTVLYTFPQNRNKSSFLVPSQWWNQFPLQVLVARKKRVLVTSVSLEWVVTLTLHSRILMQYWGRLYVKKNKASKLKYPYWTTCRAATITIVPVLWFRLYLGHFPHPLKTEVEVVAPKKPNCLLNSNKIEKERVCFVVFCKNRNEVPFQFNRRKNGTAASLRSS